ncbi:uncharacterized protein LOC119072694 [Bradysia coprophila]|uniref:uncharacterized protein LOC119072694 n=1 Tax=Bradysia coprophila TaxID=38358 RepID=UPI00187DBFD7|nr:uncharacterized protein LOC119072694 [Bradysia coprophila]
MFIHQSIVSAVIVNQYRNIRLTVMDDNENAPVLIIIILIIVFFGAIAVLLRICCSQHIAKRKVELTNRQLQVTSTSARNVQERSTGTEWTQSDHQIIFERMPQPQPLRNVSRLNAATPATQIVQEMAEQFRVNSLQMQNERRAQERRDVLDRFNNFVHMPPRLDTNIGVDGVTNGQLTEVSPNPVVGSVETTFQNNVSYSTPAPRYIAEDHELPSYEAAVATSNINR